MSAAAGHRSDEQVRDGPDLALRWELCDASTVLALRGIDTWEDPFESTPVWSGTRFRRVAVALAGGEFPHLVAVQGGRPRMAAPVIWSREPGGLLFYDPPAMIGDPRAFGPPGGTADGAGDGTGDLGPARAGAYPSLAVGTYGSQHGVLVDPALRTEDRVLLCRDLPRAVARLADEHGCRSHALLYLSRAVLEAAGPAARDATVAVLGAEARIVTDAGSFERYLDGLSMRRRQRILHERRSAQAGDVEVSVTEGAGALADDLVTLRCALRTRYGLPDKREETEREFEALDRWCGDVVVVCRSRKAGATVGFTLFVRDGDRLAARTAGFDDERLTRDDFCYFNTTYYEPLAWGLPRGIRSFDFGLSSYAAKRTRGCVFEPRFGMFSLPADGTLRRVLRAQHLGERERLETECRSALVGELHGVTQPSGPTPAHGRVAGTGGATP